MLSLEGWRVARIAGIDIRIDPTWTFIAFLVGYSFYFVLGQRFPEAEPGRMAVLAGVMSILFFASLLLHELAHAITARRRGIEVQGITLFLFGGATHARLDTNQPRDEFVIAVVGPLSSGLMAALLWASVNLFHTAMPETLAFGLGRLGWLNLMLAVFNLVPGFPLDGGRLLRAVVWSRTGDLVRATRIASRAGQVFAQILITLGIIEVLLGGLAGGLWLVAIGWYLNQAAQQSYIQLQIRRMLRGIEAVDVASRGAIEIPADTDLSTAIDDYFLRYDYNAFPVWDRERTVGILTLRAVRKVPTDRRASISARDVMEPLTTECSVDPHDRMDLVVDKLGSAASQRVLVVDSGRVVGIITPRDLARWLRTAEELELLPRPGSRSIGDR